MKMENLIKSVCKLMLMIVLAIPAAGLYGQAQTDAVAENMLVYQRSYGGWPKAIGNKKVVYDKPLTAEQKKLVQATVNDIDATIDNKATSREIVYLVKAYAQTKNQQYLDAAKKGIDYLLKAQYSNGGWPQYYPDKRLYRAQITFNDDAMINVLNMLLDIAQQSGDYAALGNDYAKKAQAAVDKGVQCILNTQYKWNGRLTAWAAQYDQQKLTPAKARAFELPSLASSESRNIVKFLMRIPNPTAEIKTAVNSAKEWFEQTKITGFKTEIINAPAEASGKDVVVVADPASTIWARFYDLETMQPFFTGRDGVPKTKLAEIDNERRVGYAWYGVWPQQLLEKEYPAWAKKNL
jgi:PelA/Pel-15E family pectate lyase